LTEVGLIMFDKKNRNVLFVSFDFPPSNRVAVQRSLAFAYHMIEKGWNVRVLTVKASCYDSIDNDLFFPQDLKERVDRTWAINTQKFGVGGKYIDFLTIPDEWVSWYLSAYIKGRSIVKQHNIGLIWSTCPPFTPHLIAGRLSQAYGIPWIADYRDPVERGKHGQGVIGQTWGINRTDDFVVRQASKVVFTTDEARKSYLETHDKKFHSKFEVIPNGYYDLPGLDREDFGTDEMKEGPLEVLYSGNIYGDRNPRIIIEALAGLIKEKRISKHDIKLVFQGGSVREVVDPLVSEFGLKDSVECRGAVGFEESLRAMHKANALLLVQGAKFNIHVPAKAYEYIAARKPIFAVCDSNGSTATLMRKIDNAAVITSLYSAKEALLKLINGEYKVTGANETIAYSRYSGAEKLNRLAGLYCKEID